MKKIFILLLTSCLMLLSSGMLLIYAENNIENEEENYEEIFTEETQELNIIKPASDYINHNTADCYYNAPNLFINNHYSAHYFFNLSENFGNNKKGSCGYVAMGMLLSYYDSFLNDDIIPDNYDEFANIGDMSVINTAESPGICFEQENLFSANITNEDYYNKVLALSSAFFHMYLIQLGEEQFNLYQETATFPANWFLEPGEENLPAGLKTRELVDLLKYYMYSLRGWNDNLVTFEVVGVNIRDYVISKVTQGQPVILAMTSVLNGGHACIAYDYDAINDEIYVHWGWDNSGSKQYNHIALSTVDQNIFLKAIAINFTIGVEHSHSNNYVDSNGNAYCSCDLFSDHPNHECRHYKEYDSNYHQYLCGCSEELFEHNLSCSYSDDSNHIKSCADCGYTQNEAHDYTHGYESVGAYKHRGYCECGAYEEFDHEFTSSGTLDVCRYCKLEKDHVHEYVYLSSKDGRTHRKLCSCGVSVLEMCFGTTMPGAQATCMNCGQILNGGSITPWSISDDALPFNKEDDDYSE